MIALNLSVTLTASFVGKAGSVEFYIGCFAMALTVLCCFLFRREKLFIAIFFGAVHDILVSCILTDFQLFTNIYGCRTGRKYILSDFHCYYYFLGNLSINLFFSYINADSILK